MKIAIGHIIQDGPFGGGNSLVLSFRRLFSQAGHEVVFDLRDPDIDIVMISDPRARSPNVSFSAGAVLRYLMLRNSRTIVVQMIQDCDERKNTRSMNKRQRIANYGADHAVAVGSWMLDLALVRDDHRHCFTAILNGGRTDIFHPRGHRAWDGMEPMRLITHHWGGNWMKGFDVYAKLDDMVADAAWRDRIAFTYVGNTPSDFGFRNARHLPPLGSEALAGELRAHHVYITASINEPAGLHHIEGALCGLPILYRRSGALPEYCDGFGVAFDGPEDVEGAVRRMFEEYDVWRANLARYDRTDERMVGEYIRLFDDLLARRDEIVAERRLWRDPFLVVRNQIAV